ncbi:MAG: hypothetical protein IIA82_07910 [Thaumarchaeota archaeon]|nr:hypothetical protein [Nitrososphaerota archaeon]
MFSSDIIISTTLLQYVLNEIFGGLETTINNFNDKVLVSKSLPNNKIIILFLPKNVNLEKVSQALHSL